MKETDLRVIKTKKHCQAACCKLLEQQLFQTITVNLILRQRTRTPHNIL